MTRLPSYRAIRGEHRDTTLALALATQPRCPECGKPCIDVGAVERHRAVNHPRFPPADEEGSD